jgi:hypothetical protein
VKQSPTTVPSDVFHVGVFRQQVFNGLEVSLFGCGEKFIRDLLLVRISLVLDTTKNRKCKKQQQQKDDNQFIHFFLLSFFPIAKGY